MHILGDMHTKGDEQYVCHSMGTCISKWALYENADHLPTKVFNTWSF